MKRLKELWELNKGQSLENLKSQDGFWLREENIKNYFVAYSYNTCGGSLILNESNYNYVKDRFNELLGINIDTLDPSNNDKIATWTFTGMGTSYFIGVHRDFLEGMELLTELKEKFNNYPIFNEDDYYDKLNYYQNQNWKDLSLKERLELLKKEAPECSIFSIRSNIVPNNNGSLDEYLSYGG